jgi:hypothetical protein
MTGVVQGTPYVGSEGGFAFLCCGPPTHRRSHNRALANRAISRNVPSTHLARWVCEKSNNDYRDTRFLRQEIRRRKTAARGN